MTQQIKRSYGWKKQQHDARDNFFGVSEPVTLPPSFRLVEGMPEIWDQGQTNSCTAHSASAAYEYELSQQHLPDFMPSRLFLYYNERIAEGTTSRDAGATIRDSVKALAKYGTLPENYWPFTERMEQRPVDADYQLAIKNIVTSYSAVPQTVQSIKTAIFQHHPVIFGFLVYESFESAEVAASGIQPMPDLFTEQCLGGHAVLAVGWDDSKKAFCIRNSWDKDWGQEGYFWMPYQYITNTQLASDFWIIESELEGLKDSESNQVGS